MELLLGTGAACKFPFMFARLKRDSIWKGCSSLSPRSVTCPRLAALQRRPPPSRPRRSPSGISSSPPSSYIFSCPSSPASCRSLPPRQTPARFRRQPHRICSAYCRCHSYSPRKRNTPRSCPSAIRLSSPAETRGSGTTSSHSAKLFDGACQSPGHPKRTSHIARASSGDR